MRFHCCLLRARARGLPATFNLLYPLYVGGSVQLTDAAQRRQRQFVVKQCGTQHCVPAPILLFPSA